MSITDKRKEVVDFTEKYYQTPARFVAAKGADFDISPEGLKCKVIGVQRATTHENFLRAKFPGADVRTYATQDEADADLASGRLDLVMADSVVLLEGFLKTDAGRASSSSAPATAIRTSTARGSGSRSARARTTCARRSTPRSRRSEPMAPTRRSTPNTSTSTSMGRPRRRAWATCRPVA